MEVAQTFKVVSSELIVLSKDQMYISQLDRRVGTAVTIMKDTALVSY